MVHFAKREGALGEPRRSARDRQGIGAAANFHDHPRLRSDPISALQASTHRAGHGAQPEGLLSSSTWLPGKNERPRRFVFPIARGATRSTERRLKLGKQPDCDSN